MEEFFGKKYVLSSQDNFEEYLAFLGVGYLARKAAMSLTPTKSLLKHEDGTYTFKFESMLANYTITFKLDEEFEETKPDGVKLKSIITFEGNKMVHRQEEASGRVSTHVREFTNEQMTTTTTATGWDKVAIRRFKAAK